MLSRLIASVLETLIGLLLRRLLGERIVNILKVTLAWVVFATLGGFCLYNLFWLVVSRTVFKLVGENRSGWIGFADDPVSFVVWSVVYSLPVSVAALVLFNDFAERRAHRRAAFRQFTDGLGPPPTVRIIDRPAAGRDKPGPGSKPKA